MNSLMFAGLLIITFFIPLNEGLTYLGALFLLIGLLRGRIRPCRTLLDLPLIAFVVFLWFSTVFSVEVITSLRAFGFICLCILIFYYWVVWVDVPESRWGLVWIVLIVSSMVVSSTGILQYFLGDKFLNLHHTTTHYFAGRLRVFSTLFNPDVLAGYLVLVLPLSAAFVLAGRKFWQKVLGLSSLSLGAICLYATFSRSGWLGFIFGLILMSFWLRNIKVFLASMCFVLMGFLLFGEFISSRIIYSFFSPDAVRMFIWRDTIQMISIKPWFGFGLFTFPVIYDPPISLHALVHAHNLFLHLMVETGVFATAAFIWLIFSVTFRAFKVLRRPTDGRTRIMIGGLVCGILAFILEEQFNVDLTINNILIMFFFMLGLLVKILHTEKRNAAA